MSNGSIQPLPKPLKRDKRATYGRLAVLIVLLVIIGFIGWVFAVEYPVRTWLAVLLLMLVFTVIVSDSVTGSKRGFLIDQRFKISLSRFQMVAWTLLVLSAVLVVALINVHIGWESPLNFQIPTDLWLLMGISTTSLVASPALLSLKTGIPEDPHSEIVELEHQGYCGIKKPKTPDDVIVRYEQQECATWLDLFKGEEYGNAKTIDFGRVQLFFFTFVAITTYGAALGSMLASTVESGAVLAFPAIDGGFITLLGISHTGYLANKLVPHTKTK